MIDKEVQDILDELKCSIEPCGSRVTCDPPPSDTDADFLVQVPAYSSKLNASIVEKLTAAGFKWEGSEHYQNMLGSDFMSFRKGSINLIVTSSMTFATRHRAATALCKRFNLLEKKDRIAVFQAVLYGEKDEQAYRGTYRASRTEVDVAELV